MDSREFWENKILNWERAKYDRLSIVDFNSSLKERQRVALRLMAPVVRGSTVVEFGCGTARLMEPILAMGAHKYIGVDFSTTAIQTAQLRVGAKDAHRVDLVCAPIEGLAPFPADFSFSLGLLDWVDPQSVATLNSPLFLHSFSELKKNSLQQMIHRAYCVVMNGRDHLPKYYSKSEVDFIFARARINFYQERRLSFGCFAHNLL